MIALPERHSVDAVLGRVAHDTEVGELDIDLLINGKHFRQSRQIVALGVQSIAHTAVSRQLSRLFRGFDDIANDNKSIVAEHLTKEVNVL